MASNSFRTGSLRASLTPDIRFCWRLSPLHVQRRVNHVHLACSATLYAREMNDFPVVSCINQIADTPEHARRFDSPARLSQRKGQCVLSLRVPSW